jgi:hypothetical protein
LHITPEFVREHTGQPIGGVAPVGHPKSVRTLIDQTLAVFDGLVLITQSGDPCDSFVAKGETFTFDRSGLALVEAVTDARLAMLAAEPSAERRNRHCLTIASRSRTSRRCRLSGRCDQMTLVDALRP